MFCDAGSGFSPDLRFSPLSKGERSPRSVLGGIGGADRIPCEASKEIASDP